MSIEFTRIRNDVNGNPRYVCHWLDVEPTRDYTLTLHERYARTVKLANTIGGRKFHNKQYGGGIVFQSYSLDETTAAIERLKQQHNGV